jgi:hypothetical protein
MKAANGLKTQKTWSKVFVIMQKVHLQKFLIRWPLSSVGQIPWNFYTEDSSSSSHCRHRSRQSRPSTTSAAM